ncbi:hypothetical protein SERLA73DRAFT_192222, partial [Serpula lacrymans var. lacrymans S7.3]
TRTPIQTSSLISSSLLTTTCDPVWSQHLPLLPLLTAVIVTCYFLKVIAIPFD